MSLAEVFLRLAWIAGFGLSVAFLLYINMCWEDDYDGY